MRGKRPVPVTKDDAVYQFILRYINTHNLSPTYREIGQACYIEETQGVAYRIKKLVDAGLITRRKWQNRDIKLVGVNHVQNL